MSRHVRFAIRHVIAGPREKFNMPLEHCMCPGPIRERECTKSRPSNRPTGNEVPNVIHARSLMSIEISSFCNASIPRRERGSLISEEGGHPSAISPSLSACPSRIAQWCQALIKRWHLTFRTETCTLFSLPKSVYCPAEALWLQI